MQLLENGGLLLDPDEAEAVKSLLMRSTTDQHEDAGMTEAHSNTCVQLGGLLTDAEQATSTLGALFKRPALALRSLAQAVANLG